MKKIICLLLAAVSIASLAACSKAPADEATTAAPTQAATVKNWLYTVFFKDIPPIGGDIIRNKEESNDKGYSYTFEVNDVDYNGIKTYVNQLEAAGFSVYNSSALGTVTTADMLPDTLPEGQHNASWVGKRRGVYVALTWYADEYYIENNLTQSYNVRLVFYSYNAFESVTK